jgi:ABC-type spermidine/putrescine transport system permease subunit I
VTLVLGFNIAYFLVFHVRGVLWQIGLFLVCTVPFLTSNIIRMISWIPFLGRNGIFNQALGGGNVPKSVFSNAPSSTATAAASPWRLYAMCGTRKARSTAAAPVLKSHG